MWDLISYCGDLFLLLITREGRGACPRSHRRRGYIVPPASLDLEGGSVEEVAKSGCDRDSIRLRVRWHCDGLRVCL